MNRINRNAIIELLQETYTDARPMLKFGNNFELLVAVVLSAQCTDERVNVVTARLFPEYNSPEKLLVLTQPQLEELIRDAGLYKTKAANLLATARLLVQQYNGRVPDKFDQLVGLPGVGRKTANVVLSVGFDIPALAVDTHVFRVSNRTGLAKGANPEEVEQKLKRVIKRDLWNKAHHWLIWHGRKVCKARKPDCASCQLVVYCDKNGVDN